MKQTAVEWLIEQLESQYIKTSGPYDVKMIIGIKEIEEAKEIEKQQIIDAKKERVVQVRQFENHKWENRVFIMEKNGKFICWNHAKTLEESKNSISVSTWEFMREISEK